MHFEMSDASESSCKLMPFRIRVHLRGWKQQEKCWTIVNVECPGKKNTRVISYLNYDHPKEMNNTPHMYDEIMKKKKH